MSYRNTQREQELIKSHSLDKVYISCQILDAMLTLSVQV